MIDLYGMQLRVVLDDTDDDNVSTCKKCALDAFCYRPDNCMCEDSWGNTNRHFELVK